MENEVTKKKCKDCLEEKEICNFSKCEKAKDKLQYRCKECDSLKRKARWEENKKAESDCNKKWYVENRDKALEYSGSYFQNNKERLMQQRKNKRHNCLKTKMIHNFRGTISSSFKRALNGGNVKNCKSLEILGCSMEFFIRYIEELFTDNMSWDNYGEWHLDHKIPISWATTEDEVYKLNKYENFQPLWAKDNLSKGNKWAD